LHTPDTLDYVPPCPFPRDVSGCQRGRDALVPARCFFWTLVFTWFYTTPYLAFPASAAVSCFFLFFLPNTLPTNHPFPPPSQRRPRLTSPPLCLKFLHTTPNPLIDPTGSPSVARWSLAGVFFFVGSRLSNKPLHFIFKPVVFLFFGGVKPNPPPPSSMCFFLFVYFPFLSSPPEKCRKLAATPNSPWSFFVLYLVPPMSQKIRPWDLSRNLFAFHVKTNFRIPLPHPGRIAPRCAVLQPPLYAFFVL